MISAGTSAYQFRKKYQNLTFKYVQARNIASMKLIINPDVCIPCSSVAVMQRLALKIIPAYLQLKQAVKIVLYSGLP